MSRGFISLSCFYALDRCSGNEQVAQVLALQYASFSNAPSDIQWEVNPGGGSRVDIVINTPEGLRVTEVKEYTGGDPLTGSIHRDAQQQALQYVAQLNKTSLKRGLTITAALDPNFSGFSTTFIGSHGDKYVEWSPQAGLIYFAKVGRIEKLASKYSSELDGVSRDAARDLTYEATNIRAGGGGPFGWIPSWWPRIPGTRVPLPPPIPIPVPVPA